MENVIYGDSMNIKKTILLLKKVPVWVIATAVLIVTVVVIVIGTK